MPCKAAAALGIHPHNRKDTRHEDSTAPPARTLTQAERADEVRRMARAVVIGGVRRNVCTRCGARTYGPCQVSPPGDCLARWLRAYSPGRITRADLIAAIGGLVIITAAQLVEERSA